MARLIPDERPSNEVVPYYPAQTRIEDEWGDVATHGNGTISYVNESGLPEEAAQNAWDQGITLDGRPVKDEIASAIDTWSRNLNSPSIAGGSLFFRNRYTMTENVYDQMLQCADAVEYDEVLGSICDATEGLAFGRLSLEMVDQDQEDVWNQISEDIDLDTRMREMWRELFKISQFYVGIDWQHKTYRVRTSASPIQDLEDSTYALPGSQPGAEDLHSTGVPMPGPKRRARRKTFALTAPAALTIFDPTKILPVGQLLFNQERFAYIATQAEHEAFTKAFNGERIDNMVLKLLEGPYKPTIEEAHVLADEHRVGRDARTNRSYLWLFKRDVIFRHTLSRAQYERFAAVRLKSALPTLDMKSHLRASDRASLIGATNFIILLRRGTDKYPVRPGEVDQLREQARVVARMPILVGDHRLSVEIITPKTDFVLDYAKYNTLDERLVMRGLHSFRFGGRQAGSSDMAANTDEEIARGIESRRTDLARTLEEKIFKATVLKNEAVLNEVPRITFHPKRVVISIDSNLMKIILQLRNQGTSPARRSWKSSTTTRRSSTSAASAKRA